MKRPTPTSKTTRRAAARSRRRESATATVELPAGATKFSDLPLSERDHGWDAEGAEQRVHVWSGAQADPSARYLSAFLWHDDDYSFGFADVVDGELVAVFRGVTDVAAAIHAGDVDLPEDELAALRSHIGRYYDKAAAEYDDPEIAPPWEAEETDLLEPLTETGEAHLTVAPDSEVPGTIGTRPDDAQPGEQLAAGDDGLVPTEHAPRDVRPDRNPSAEVDMPEGTTNAAQVKWEGVLLVEGKLTEDGRYIEPGATTWRELPLTLSAMLETDEGHKGAQVCGRVDQIWRNGDFIMGAGVFDDSEFGAEIARMVGDGVLRGNSVDLAVREFELAPRDDFDENGHRVRSDEEEADEADLLELLFGTDMVFIFTDCVIGMSTVCPFPAFADAQISLAASGRWQATRQGQFAVVAVESPLEEAEDVVVASAFEVPTVPPAEWFADPELEDLTALTVTDDGRVFGHAAAWGTCHTGIPDVCTEAPHSLTDYASFLLGEVEVEGGERVPVGKITLDGPHANKRLSLEAATAHYDNTGTAVADVTVGEDDHGIWVAGAIRPGTSEERVRELRASPLSGDWRAFEGNLELVALLAVNVPGFPVPRVRALVAAAEDEAPQVLTLVSTGLPSLDVPRLTDGQRARLDVLADVARGGVEALAARVA